MNDMNERESGFNDDLMKKMSDDIRFFMEKLGYENSNTKKFWKIPNIKETRTIVINSDDVINLKVSLGLYESGKISFEEMLETL
ncbi:MAG: hypothetical protein ACOC1O_01550 [bacterium]